MNFMCLRQCSVLILTLVFSLVANARIIYGFENASNFDSRNNGPFYVQAGAFRSESSALKLKTQIEHRVPYSVEVRHSGKYYSVLIGPMSTIAAVHSVGSKQQPTLKTKRVGKVKQSIQVIPSQKAVSSTKLHSPIATSQFRPNLGGKWFVGADLGVLYPLKNNVMRVNNGSFYPEPLNVDEYSVSQPDLTLLAFLVGQQWERSEKWLPAYELALKYQHIFPQTINGSITQYSLPEFKNYEYTWEVGAEALSLYSKLDIVKVGRIMPYIDAGLGISFNRSLGYQEAAYAGVTPRVSPAFSSHTNENFAYNVGAGVDVILTPKVSMSMGYEYQFFGQLISGSGLSTWSGEKLNLGDLSTNSVKIGISYLIDEPLSPEYRK